MDNHFTGTTEATAQTSIMYRWVDVFSYWGMRTPLGLFYCSPRRELYFGEGWSAYAPGECGDNELGRFESLFEAMGVAEFVYRSMTK
jgi:hypothetical protein